MALSVFDDKAKAPSGGDLKESLGRSHTHWIKLVSHVSTEYAPLTEKWSYAGAKWGWALQLKQKKRTVLYMTPCRKYFVVGFALGEKAVNAARKSDLSPSVLSAVEGSTKYAEGRAVRLEVRTKVDLESVKILAAIKMAN